MYALYDPVQRRCEALHLFPRLLQQVKCEPLGRLAADAGQPGQFRDQAVDRAHQGVRAPD
jgi:hypothetical protein